MSQSSNGRIVPRHAACPRCGSVTEQNRTDTWSIEWCLVTDEITCGWCRLVYQQAHPNLHRHEARESKRPERVDGNGDRLIVCDWCDAMVHRRYERARVRLPASPLSPVEGEPTP